MAMGLTAIVVILVAVLLQRDQRRSGTDLTPNGAFVAALGAGQQTCQNQELLPADTSAVRMTIGSYGRPGPPVKVAFTGPRGQTLSAGTLPAGWREGVVQIPVSHVSKATDGVQVCLRDGGHEPIAIAGAVPDPGYQMQVGSKTVEGRLRYDYMRPGRESWLELIPTIVHRSTLAKSGLVRHWAWVGALLLMLASIGLAARTILREATS
jgi:hypothetical protein